jgi:hypothetical protein
MLIAQTLFWLFAASVPGIGLVVLVRLLWSAYVAWRAARFRLVALSVLGMACMAGLFIVVAGVWFGYGVAHTEKDLWSDLRVALLTGIPYYLAAFGLWRMARRIQPGSGS